MIKIVNLTKRYKDRVVLKNISHQFPKKGLCIIYGPSGCGKTTLLNCIAGLLSFEGSVQLDHKRLESMSESSGLYLRAFSQYSTALSNSSILIYAIPSLL